MTGAKRGHRPERRGGKSSLEAHGAPSAKSPSQNAVAAYGSCLLAVGESSMRTAMVVPGIDHVSSPEKAVALATSEP